MGDDALDGMAIVVVLCSSFSPSRLVVVGGSGRREDG